MAERDTRQTELSRYPLISVVTPSYNQGQYIEEAIISVLRQGYPHFEHIIMDGGSTDNTLTVLKKYPHLTWISEKDKGQSDALNKAMKMAKGEIIAWINSDDFYYGNAFFRVVEAFRTRPQAKAVIGDCLFYYDVACRQMVSVNREMGFEDLIRYWDDGIPPNQPSIFFKRELFDELGYFDVGLQCTMDDDFFMRVSLNHRFYYIPHILAGYRLQKDSKTGLGDWTPFYPEYHTVYKRYKEHSAILPKTTLVTCALPLAKVLEHQRHWHLEDVRRTVQMLQGQVLQDMEILVVTDFSEAEYESPAWRDSRISVRVVTVPAVDEESFYEALCTHAQGHFLYCPSFDWPLNIHWFIHALDHLLDHSDTPLCIDWATDFSLHPVCTSIGLLAPCVFARRSLLEPFEAFTFPEAQNPEVSVILCASQWSPFTYHCLKAIERSINHVSLEVEVIIAAPEEAAGRWRNLVGNAVCLQGEKGKVHTANLAVAKAQGGFLIFLDPEVLVLPSTLSLLVKTLMGNDRAAAACPAELWGAEGHLKMAGGMIFADGTRYEAGRLDDPAKPEYSFVRPVHYPSPRCFAIKKELWQRAGGLNPAFDFDYACAGLGLALIELGYGTIYVPAAQAFYFNVEAIYRQGKLTPGTYETDLDQKARFHEEWQYLLNQPEWAQGMNAFTRTGRFCASIVLHSCASLFTRKKEILLLDHQVPAAHHLDRLHRLVLIFLNSGFDVTFSPHPTLPHPLTSDFQGLGVKVLTGSLDLSRFLEHNRGVYDVVWLCLGVLFSLPALVRRIFTDTPIVCDASTKESQFTTEEFFLAGSSDFTITQNDEILHELKSRLSHLPIEMISSSKMDERIPSLIQSLARTPQAATSGDFLTLDKSAIQKAAGEGYTRPVYLWGGGRGGRQTLDLLRKTGIKAAGFVDKDPKRWGIDFMGLPVHPPHILALPVDRNKGPYVLIASSYYLEIARELEAMGFIENQDYRIMNVWCLHPEDI